MLQLAYHNSKIDWRIGEVKMSRYLEECGKQQRLKQKKVGQKKQKKEEEERRKEKTNKEENDGSKEDSRRMGDLG